MRTSRADGERCEGCELLTGEMARLREASGRRARDDHDRCVALYAQMERLARINRSALDDNGAGGGDSDGERGCALSERVDPRQMTGQDERVERLQGIIVEQAKELERLRRRASWRYRRHRPKISDAMDLLSLSGNQDDEEELEAVGEREIAVTVRADQAPTSLLAQLDAKDRRIHALEVALTKAEAQLHHVQTKKIEAARESKRQLDRLGQQTRKYEAFIKKQQHETQSLEKKHAATRQYVDVLERKLMSSGPDKRAGR